MKRYNKAKLRVLGGFLRANARCSGSAVRTQGMMVRFLCVNKSARIAGEWMCKKVACVDFPVCIPVYRDEMDVSDGKLTQERQAEMARGYGQ